MTRKAGYPAKDIQGVDGRENDGETEVGAPAAGDVESAISSWIPCL